MSNMLVMVMVVITLFASVGCAAVPPEVPENEMWMLAEGSTVAGAQAVANGAMHFGKIFQQGPYIVMTWPVGGNVGWAALMFDTTKMTLLSDRASIIKALGGCAGILSSKSIGAFAGYLKSIGYTAIEAKDLPAFLKAAINNAKSFTFLVVPMGSFKTVDDLLMNDPIQQ